MLNFALKQLLFHNDFIAFAKAISNLVSIKRHLFNRFTTFNLQEEPSLSLENGHLFTIDESLFDIDAMGLPRHLICKEIVETAISILIAEESQENALVIFTQITSQIFKISIKTKLY